MRRKSWRISKSEAGQKLDRFLEERLGPPEAKLYLERGAVYLEGRRCQGAAQPLREGQVVAVVMEEGGKGVLPAAGVLPILEILFEDEDCIAVNKPTGFAAQPTPGRKGDSLLDAVAAHLGRPPGLVHRLDRETSGVTVFGKSKAATSSLAAQFRAGAARKQYLAVTGPRLPQNGTVDTAISKDPSHPARWRASARANGQPARTDYLRLYQGEEYCLVQMFPRTGRTHQIRVHLQSLGSPIAGDKLYGGPMRIFEKSIDRCLLHARALVVNHPRTKSPLRLDAALPEDMAFFFERARVPVPTFGESPSTPSRV